MLRKIIRENSTTISLQAGLILVLLFGASSAFGQTAETKPDETMSQSETQKTETPKPVMQPVWNGYKDVKIGTTADEVRDRLGKKATIDDKDGFYYEKDGEAIQIRLDADKRVKIISVTYASDNKTAPKFEDVFGSGVTVEPSADGKIYKLINYPEAGYWIAYSQTAGEKPIVTVTMQKL